MFTKTFKRRVIPAALAMVAIPALAPTASAMTAEDVQGTVQSHVAGIQAQAGSWLNQYGQETSIALPHTTISNDQGEITVPVALPEFATDALDALPGVEVHSWNYTAGITQAEPEVVRIENNSLEPGTERITQQGEGAWNWNAGAESGMITSGSPTVIEYANPAPEPAPAPVDHVAGITQNDSVWQALSQCESGGDWHINTGNGYYGGLQFSPSTWTGYGGGAYAATADQATREQQIEIAQRVQAGQGWGAWPACTSALGIR